MSDHEQKALEEISSKARELRKRANSGLVADEREEMALLRQATEISPEFFDAHFDFALAALRYGRKIHTRAEQSKLDEIAKEAGQSLDKCIELRPWLAPPYAWSACVAFLNKDHQRGIELANKALDIDSGNFEAILHKGTICLELAKKELYRDDPEEALKYARKAIRLLSKARSICPASFEAVYGLASACERSGAAAYDLGDEEKSHSSFEQALERYREAAGFAIDQEEYSEQMAFANLHCGRMMRILLRSFGERYSDRSWENMQKKIIKHMTAAIEHKPDLAEAFKYRADAKICTERLDEARADVIAAQEYIDDPELKVMLLTIDTTIKVKKEARMEAEAARGASQAEGAGARA